jgi:hypothetical protein
MDYEGLGKIAAASSAHLVFQLLQQRHEKLASGKPSQNNRR